MNETETKADREKRMAEIDALVRPLGGEVVGEFITFSGGHIHVDEVDIHKLLATVFSEGEQMGRRLLQRKIRDVLGVQS